jgi:hypothetical protein
MKKFFDDIDDEIIDEICSPMDVGTHTHEVLSTTITNNWLKRLITGRKTEVVYYIRRTTQWRHYKTLKYLSWESTSFSFKISKSIDELVVWDNQDEPASLIIAAKLREKETSQVDEVVFSSDDL